MQKEKVLVLHNAYQHRGGEDSVVEDEVKLLIQNNHPVHLHLVHNNQINEMKNIQLLKDTIWSSSSKNDVTNIIKEFKPDIIHAHNTFPLMSPSIYWAAHNENVPIIQTLHNFRIICPQAMLLRKGKICEDCVGKIPWRSVVRSCYRDSPVQSAVLTGMLTAHRALGTWQNKVSRYIALNTFCKDKFIQSGIPAEKISIKPNFVDYQIIHKNNRSGFIFIGRLSPEKGISTLCSAAEILNNVEIKVAGTGSELPLLNGIKNILYIGTLNKDEVAQEMSSATALVLPSIWYENFPRTIVEAMANGLPVIASRIGSLPEIVHDGVTGLLFNPGDASDLAEKILTLENNPTLASKMGEAARKKYEESYTGDINYRQLVEIYRDAIASRGEINNQI